MDEMDLGPADNPVYQQLKMQLAQADATVASMRSRVGEYQRRVDRLQEMVDTIPKIEAELKQLDRDYSVHQKNYQALLARREAANISEQAEISGDQFKFRVVDPPRVPLQPSAPNRPLLMTGVLLGGIVAGASLALLLFLLRPTFDSPRTVMEVLGRPVLGGVSMIHNREWSNKHRQALIAFSLAGIGLLALYVGVLSVGGLGNNLAAISGAGLMSIFEKAFEKAGKSSDKRPADELFVDPADELPDLPGYPAEDESDSVLVDAADSSEAVESVAQPEPWNEASVICRFGQAGQAGSQWVESRRAGRSRLKGSQPDH